LKIAIIKWKDSTLHGTDQIYGDSDELKPMDGISCGLLVRKTRDSITIATDYWGNDQWRNCETIYRKQVYHLTIKEIHMEVDRGHEPLGEHHSEDRKRAVG
jgi:hypothetical protein